MKHNIISVAVRVQLRWPRRKLTRRKILFSLLGSLPLLVRLARRIAITLKGYAVHLGLLFWLSG
ncbi:MAG: hypothetical protein HYZ71_14235 [Deltaproteobacteria bacterium]|nr:hypothetical protein [Deltaproteobacteria bacterium]